MVTYFKELSPVLQALYATMFTWSVTALGASLVFFFRRLNKIILDGMLGFAAGVMIAATIWSLIIPAIEIAKSLKMNIALMISIGFIAGSLIIFSRKYNKKIYEKKIIVPCLKDVMLIISITLHNIPEGLVRLLLELFI